MVNSKKRFPRHTEASSIMILDWTSGFKRRHLSDTDDARGSDLLFLAAMILIMSHAILRELSLLRLIWVTQSRDQPANWWLFYDCRATHDIETHSVHFKSKLGHYKAFY